MSKTSVSQPTPVPQPAKKKSKLSTLAPTDLTLLTDALHQLNKEVCVVFDLGRIAILPTSTRPKLNLITFETFINNLYADRRVADISVADVWRKWNMRRVVNSIVYEPGKPTFTPEGNYNEWRGSGLVPKEGPIVLWNQLLDHLFAKEPTYRDWFEAWLAYPFQHPGTKLHTAAVFWSSGSGTGKSTVGYILKHLYGLHNYTLLRDADIGGPFNSWAAQKQFVEAEEVRGGSNAQKNADYMKSMITQHEIRVNEKHKAHYVIRDCINYYFTSNHSDALYLQEYDRRFFVHGIPNKPLPDTFFENQLKPWLHKEGGLEAILYHLLHIDLSRPIVGGSNRSLDPSPFRPGGFAPHTEARAAMILESMDDAEAWAYNLRRYPENFPQALGHTLFTIKELIYLYRLEYPKDRNGTQFLSRRFRSKLVQVGGSNPVQLENGSRERLLSIDVEHEKMTHAQLKAVYAQEFEKSCAGIIQAE